MKVVGYCRVSTRNGNIEIQLSAIERYGEKENLELVKIFEDQGVSGGLADRPALLEMMDYLDVNKDVKKVIIYKLDRLARDLLIQESIIQQFRKRDVELISVKEPGLLSGDSVRKLMRQLLGAFAEFEKSLITTRLKAGRRRKARKGGYSGGGSAYGYKAVKGQLEVDHERAETIRLIFKLRKKKMSMQKIADHLNREGIPTARNGEKWYACGVGYILKNPKYRGLSVYGDVSVKNENLKIIGG